MFGKITTSVGSIIICLCAIILSFFLLLKGSMLALILIIVMAFTIGSCVNTIVKEIK